MFIIAFSSTFMNSLPSFSQLQNQTEITIALPNLVENATKLKMIRIPAGQFKMGSPETEPGRDAEKDWPAHLVTISKPFYIGKYEVTQAQWEAVLSPNSHRSKFKGRPNNPVEKVSWRECQKFIEKLNEIGLGKFRLPTEAEWEYACRAGSSARFCCGDSMQTAEQYMWFQANNNSLSPFEVGQKRPNAWGLFDMHGNVLEWCADQWKAPYARSAQTDPLENGFSLLFFFTNRVFKGGSYQEDISQLRSASRRYEQEFDYHYTLGFRLVREID